MQHEIAQNPRRHPHSLRIVCVGTGRDGTQSLAHMIQHTFDAVRLAEPAAASRRVMHEYCCREIYQAFCDHQETGGTRHLSALERMVAECPHDCIVGNGYAPILPMFAGHYGRGLKLIHLRRADRDACVASLKKNCELFPTAYGYYSSSPEAVVKRMAAFHFGEMPRAEWDKLPIEEKLGWYYDKTHALVRQHRGLFDECVEIHTETLNDEATRRAIARLATDDDWAAPPRTHLNASAVDISSCPPEHRHRMHWLMGRLNLDAVAADDVYALDYFANKFIAWTGYQITNAPQLAPASAPPPEKIEENLDRALKVAKGAVREIEALRDALRDRAKEPKS
jgi:hypothetical protein